LQAKPLRRGKTLTPLYLQPVQRISTSFWTEKQGGPPGRQTPASRWLRKTRTRLAKQYMVLPQTTLDQISTAPWKNRPAPREKRETD
jgi:hypothetical protein